MFQLFARCVYGWNTKRQFDTANCLFCCLVRVLCPVMHEQPVNRISVEPSRAEQGGNQRARLTVPLNPGLDCLIGVLAKIPLRRKAPGEVPDSLKASKRHVLGAAQPGFQVCEFRMIRYCPECH